MKLLERAFISLEAIKFDYHFFVYLRLIVRIFYFAFSRFMPKIYIFLLIVSLLDTRYIYYFNLYLELLFPSYQYILFYGSVYT